MNKEYIHTDQLHESRNNVLVAAEPLTAFVSWALFAEKPKVSISIGAIETKAKIVIRETGMTPDQLVEHLVSFLMLTFLKYKPLGRSYKSILLNRINHDLDRLLSSGSIKKSKNIVEKQTKDFDLFDNKPTAKKPVVVIRRRKKALTEETSDSEKPWSYVDICQ